jgi:hypothetical protein
LNDNSEDLDNYEDVVVEEVCKHIKLMLSNLPAVDFIEHLKEYEQVEKHCEVNSILFCPWFSISSKWNF